VVDSIELGAVTDDHRRTTASNQFFNLHSRQPVIQEDQHATGSRHRVIEINPTVVIGTDDRHTVTGPHLGGNDSDGASDALMQIGERKAAVSVDQGDGIRIGTCDLSDDLVKEHRDQLQTVPAGGLPTSTPTNAVTSPERGGVVVDEVEVDELDPSVVDGAMVVVGGAALSSASV